MKSSIPFFLALSLVATGQEPPVPGAESPQPPVPSPVPDLDPETPAGGGAVVRRVQVDPNKLVVQAGDFLAEANITVLEAAKIYEQSSGKRAILTNAVAQGEVSFTLGGPLTNAELAKFLQLTLLAEGIAIIPVPGEPGIVRFVPSGPITSPGQVPKGVYFDEFDLPVEDEVVMFVMPFKYLKPEEGLKVIQSSMGQLTASGTITAVPNASSLIVTENASLIRQMLKIRKAIDVPSTVGDLWVEVTYGDVEEIAERMNEIYNDQTGGNQTTRTTRTNTPTPPGGAGGATSGEEVPLRIIGVPRTSRILLVGRPADLIAAEAMIKSFDQPSSGNTRQTFRLRYLRVSEFLTIAQDAITVTLGDAEGAGLGGNRRPNTPLNNNTRNNANNTRNNNSRQSGQQGGLGGGGRATIQEQQIPTAPESILVGRTLLVGDNVANTVIVNGPPHHIEIVRDLIGDLDTEAQQVSLAAVVGSYGLSNGQNFGIDLARALQRTGADFAAAGAASFGGVPSVIDPGTLTELGDVLSANGAAGSGLSIYGLLGDDFGVFVNALETQTKFKTLERTTLTTRNNRVAELSSGQRIAVPSSTFAGGINQGGVTTNVEFRDVVLALQIQPLINSDDQVSLEIGLVRDSIGQERQVGELLVPDINTEELTTSVTVQDGSAVILGGIMTTMENDGKSGLPILSRIPGIGRLFGRNNQSLEESELIIMIQPRILSGQGGMDNFRSDYENISRYTRETGELLPAPSGGVLPAQGTIPDTANPKGSVVPVSQAPVGQAVRPPFSVRKGGRR
jgi:type II secretion system protein D